MRSSSLVILLVLAAPLCAQETGKVDLQVVKYDRLAKIIQTNRGKVVLVDFWFLSCHPCKKNMPHIVDLHNKHARAGLVVVTVDNDEPASREKSLEFLTQVGARFTNLLLDEPAAFYEKHLRVEYYPCYYVFDRRGNWTQFSATAETEVDLNALDAFVARSLKER